MAQPGDLEQARIQPAPDVALAAALAVFIEEGDRVMATRLLEMALSDVEGLSGTERRRVAANIAANLFAD